MILWGPVDRLLLKHGSGHGHGFTDSKIKMLKLSKNKRRENNRISVRILTIYMYSYLGFMAKKKKLAYRALKRINYRQDLTIIRPNMKK